jgi:hypothetical protein
MLSFIAKRHAHCPTSVSPEGAWRAAKPSYPIRLLIARTRVARLWSLRTALPQTACSRRAVERAKGRASHLWPAKRALKISTKRAQNWHSNLTRPVSAEGLVPQACKCSAATSGAATGVVHGVDATLVQPGRNRARSALYRVAGAAARARLVSYWLLAVRYCLGQATPVTPILAASCSVHAGSARCGRASAHRSARPAAMIELT